MQAVDRPESSLTRIETAAAMAALENLDVGRLYLRFSACPDDICCEKFVKELAGRLASRKNFQ